MISAVTISLVPEARGGPFVFWEGLRLGCERAAAHGFDAVEIFPRSADELDHLELERTLSQLGLKLAAMGTGAGWVVRKLRLTDPDAAIRKQALQFARSIVQLAGRFGAPAIIGSMQGRAEGGVTREESLHWLGEALEQLASHASGFGVPVLIEPLNRYETNLLNNVADGLSLLASLRATNVMLLCDLFHMNIEEPSIPGALVAAGPKVGHLHFADTNRKAVGFGHLDVLQISDALREIGYAGPVSAEILPLPDSETAASQTIRSFQALHARSRPVKASQPN
jgi:sugar phosphate isomerase/epimerase